MSKPEPLSFLSSEEIEAIHNATLRILSEVGVKLAHPEGREILAGSGAIIEGERLCLPPELIENSLAKCPNTVNLRGRDEISAVLGNGSPSLAQLGWGA